MQIEAVHLRSKQTLYNDFKHNYDRVSDKFQYNPYDPSIWEKRYGYVKSKSYQRKELVKALETMNDIWQAPAATFKNIEKLLDEESTVVIAGQQAGLLTGPLYTIHKIISVLQLAEEKSRQLGRPVIPVFWIAGEDHDFDEINHIMVKDGERIKKAAISQRPALKSSVSDIPMDQSKAEAWMNEVFSFVQETAYTHDFYHQTINELKKSKSYSDFFARMIYQLFPEQGLVAVDAHAPDIRKLETPYFRSMIDKNEQVAKGVNQAIRTNQEQNYETVLDSETDEAHLFMTVKGERTLLVRDEEGRYRGKNNEITLTKEELLQIAEEAPSTLSNNVVTRPLMQELLFPVLAFIGGPGEINYWSVLKPAFDSLDLEMPPVIPRLSFTWIDSKADQMLERFNLPVYKAIAEGVAETKLNWIASKSTPSIEHLSREIKKEMERIHQPLREKASELSPDLAALAEKNLVYIHQQVNFLEKRLNKAVEDTYKNEISQFNDLELTVYPNGGLQERVWSVLPLINQEGMDLFQRIDWDPLSYEEDHYIIYF